MEVDWIDAAVLAEELTEIYSTPTPKAWPEPKKIIDFVFDWLMILQKPGFAIYTWSLKTNLTQIRPNTILWYEGNISILR